MKRVAEKDLARLSSEIHDRVIAAIQALARNPARLAAASWPKANTTGASAWAELEDAEPHSGLGPTPTVLQHSAQPLR